MKALVQDGYDEALARSRKAWRDYMGREKFPQDKTDFKWMIVKHATEEQYAVTFADNENTALFTPEELNEIVPVEELQAEGWYPLKMVSV